MSVFARWPVYLFCVPECARACLFWLAINSQLFRTVFTQADPYHELGHGSESYNPLICYRNNSCLNVLWFDKWAFELNCCLCTVLARNAQFLFNSTVLPYFWCLKSALILLLLQSWHLRKQEFCTENWRTVNKTSKVKTGIFSENGNDLQVYHIFLLSRIRKLFFNPWIKYF